MRHILPEDIERTSMEIISRELVERGIILPEEHAAVVKRVIHTTADFDFAQNLYFTPGAVSAGMTALRNGATVITDTNMAKAGISKPALARLGGQVCCFMADGDVARAAKEKGTTRAVAAVEKAARQYPNAVFAIGNAPTALLRVAELIQSGLLYPALVVGVPVGFVNVAESKEMALAVCRRKDIPAILAMGRKGGSTVAAAICNALLYHTMEIGDDAANLPGINVCDRPLPTELLKVCPTPAVIRKCQGKTKNF